MVWLCLSQNFVCESTTWRYCWKTSRVMLCGGFTPGETLLGYYQGIPLTERGIDYGMGEVLPDRVTVYKKANSG
jgi:hypothetical protein